MTKKQFANYVLQIEDFCKSVFATRRSYTVIPNWSAKSIIVVITPVLPFERDTPDDIREDTEHFIHLFDTSAVYYFKGNYIINL